MRTFFRKVNFIALFGLFVLGGFAMATTEKAQTPTVYFDVDDTWKPIPQGVTYNCIQDDRDCLGSGTVSDPQPIPGSQGIPVQASAL